MYHSCQLFSNSPGSWAVSQLKGQEEGNPLKSWDETCLSLSCRWTRQQIKPRCGAMPRREIFHPSAQTPATCDIQWEWSEVGALSVARRPQSLCAASQSRQNFILKVLLTGRTRLILIWHFLIHRAAFSWWSGWECSVSGNYHSLCLMIIELSVINVAYNCVFDVFAGRALFF